MKTDTSFKLVIAIVCAGVIAAFAGSSPAPVAADADPATIPAAALHTE